LVLNIAKAGDSAAILAACREVWPEEGFTEDRIREALQDPHHASTIAVQNERVLGFIDGFVTYSADGCPRWEVDLLGVIPGCRGCGIGLQLVQSSLRQAAKYRPVFARALIRMDNIASRAVFRKAKFLEDGGTLELFCSRQPPEEGVALPAAAFLVPVRTFSYRGRWLEGELTESAFLAARPDLKAGDGLAGALVASSDGISRSLASDAGFSKVGDYRWWFHPLQKI